jgi:hypothetical protein
MTPEPAMQVDKPFVIDDRIWRRIVVVFYLAASSAAAALGPGMRHDLAWIPELAWVANIAIVLAAIAVARTHAPPRLQLALAFAAPVLHGVILSAMATYSGELSMGEYILMMGSLLSWVYPAQFLGSVVAIVIALASRRTSIRPGAVPSVALRMFRALGWTSAASWLYMHGYLLAVNHWPEYRPYLDGLLWRIFQVATVVAWGLSPLWIVGAIGLALSSFSRKQRPALADTAVLVLVICLMGAYLALAIFLDD